MFRNYFITAFRHFLRNKLQSFIQVISLTIGITAVILIGLYVDHETSYDKFNEHYERIYRLEYGNRSSISTAIGHQIKETFNGVEDVARMWTFSTGSQIFSYIRDDPGSQDGETQIRARYLYCDSTVFNIFTLPFIQGDPASALIDPYSVVITERIAKSLFGEKDPVGETIDMDWAPPKTRLHTVTGVIHDIKNFHLDVDVLISLESLNEVDIVNPLPSGEKWLNAWNHEMTTYLLLPSPLEKEKIQNRINLAFGEKMKVSNLYWEESEFVLRPMSDLYFSETMLGRSLNPLHGNIRFVRILLAVSMIILLLACINYINLNTARASLRAREVGVRRVLGSSRSRLIAQFLVESVLTCLGSYMVALTLVQIIFPTFVQLVGKDISSFQLFQPQGLSMSLTGILLLGLFAGFYPALYITRFQTIASLKSEQRSGLKSLLFRRILLSTQFTISLVLIFAVTTILAQVSYMKKTDLGFGRELILHHIHDGLNRKREFDERYAYKEALLRNPNIVNVAFGTVPGDTHRKFFFASDVMCNGIPLRRPAWCPCDPEYFPLLDVKILEGRNFSFEIAADNPKILDTALIGRVIINETAMKELGLDSPVGKVITREHTGWEGEIIGVVEDFHMYSLHEKIPPTIYQWVAASGGILIKIIPYDIPGTLDFIRKEFRSAVPNNNGFQYGFLEDSFNQQYQGDIRLLRIIVNFAIVALLIGCLGLFGLSTYMAARRTKEIGIRKAMGASIRRVFLLLSMEFIPWVTLSLVIACPAAWIIMNEWLQNYAYQITIGWWIFALTIILAFAVAFITVAWQSLKTARTNPVKALRYE